LRSEIAKRIVESGLGLVELRSTQMSLEDVFLKLVTSEPEAQEAEEAGTKAT
jgi:ABC-2 type transport system ATP-binding protein